MAEPSADLESERPSMPLTRELDPTPSPRAAALPPPPSEMALGPITVPPLEPPPASLEPGARAARRRLSSAVWLALCVAGAALAVYLHG